LFFDSINTKDLMLKSDFDLLLFPEFLRCPGDQIIRIFYYIPDVIGELSGPVGDKLPLLQHDDTHIRILSAGCAGCGGTGRRAPYDDHIIFFARHAFLLYNNPERGIRRTF
jgi:hypothetical protein